MIRSRHSLALIAIYYLYLPLLIFMVSWMKPWIGIPLAAICGVAPIWLFRNIGGQGVTMGRRKWFIVLAVLAAWVLLAGVGGFLWQNRWDHWFRNAVFADMVNRPWPVANGDSILTYYIGYWLFPAALSKLFGSIAVGYFTQYVYGLAGILIAFKLTIDLVGNFRWRYLAVFILFSGLDLLGLLLSGESIREDFHIELWSSHAMWESNTTLLFWVYNQAIPAWVATMLILSYGKENGVGATVISYMLISAPFPAIGLTPLVVYYLICNICKEHRFLGKLAVIFSPANLLSIVGAIPVILYCSTNRAASLKPSIGIDNPVHWILGIILLIVLEFGIYLPFIYKQIRRDSTFWVLALTAIFLMIIMPSDAWDMKSRAELPLSFFLTCQIMVYLNGWDRETRRRKLLFLMVAALAVITPALEMGRTVYASIKRPQSEYRSFKHESIFDFELLRSNFIADSVRQLPQYEIVSSVFDYDEPDEPADSAGIR